MASTLIFLLVSLSTLIVCISQSSGELKRCSECPSGWWCHARHCYNLTTDRVTWLSARHQCVGRGGDLASLATADEQDFVVGLVRASSLTETSVYIGLSTLDSATLHWSDGLPVGFTNWKSEIGSGECVAVNAGDGRWSAVSCEETLPFVCKKRSESFIGEARLVDVVEPNNGRIELFIRGQWMPVCSKGWHRRDAEVVCRQLGFDEVIMTHPGSESEVQLGGRDGNGIQECVRVDCEGNEREVAQCEFGFELWDGVEVTCATRMDDRVPVLNLKRSLSDVCEIRWSYYNGMCYYVEPIFTLAKPSSPQLCSSIGGRLVSITSSREQDFISSLLNSSKEYWIGLEKSDKEDGKFQWSDESEFTFSQWDSYEPKLNKTSDDHDCVWMKNVSGEFVWQTVKCDKLRNMICKQRAGPTPTPIPTPVPIDLQCPPGWTKSAEQCYFENSSKSTWADAEPSCIKEGGHLTSIHSAIDLAGVAIATHVWIGLNDRSIEGRYSWTDGSALNFVNWTASQTNVALDQRDCILAVRGAWEVRDCSEEHKFVCKQPAVEDVDECNLGKYNCRRHSSCVNTLGSYECQCHPGFSGPKCHDIYECDIKGICHEYAICDNTKGSYKCICRSGTFGDGKNCTDIDECASNSHNCSEHATCRNKHKTYNCICKAGWRKRSRHDCEQDIDECEEGNYSCEPHATCQNTDGSYECVCNAGWQKKGNSCVDVNECHNGSHDCSSNANCLNTDGSYECRCKEGYTGDGKICEDVDECKSGEDNCHNKARCINMEGSFSCNCMPGWTGSGVTCADIDECSLKGSCDYHAGCTNSQGSYLCFCRSGWRGNGSVCHDVNECERDTHRCHREANCTNTIGSYNCTCKSPAWVNDGSYNCLDVDECEKEIDECDRNAACENVIGSYTCRCRSGYTGDGRRCVDINECDDDSHSCDANAACGNTIGSYTCRCRSGYTGDGRRCVDINECDDGSHNCDSNAECNNTNGSFTCECQPGWKGNGIVCVDKDECVKKSDNECDQHATCSNNPGSYSCVCDPGWTGDGSTCHDIDECDEGLHECDPNAMCQDSDGSYNCSCKAGYIGDGRTCQRRSCTTLVAPKYGMKYGNRYKFGDKVEFKCNRGYKIAGSHRLSCQADGKWTNVMPECHEINECTTSLHNCSVNAVCSNVKGSFRCECKEGYHGNGYQCEIDKCDDLKRIRNGHKTNSNVTYGSIVKFSCNNGFRLSGAKSVLCQSKGQWNDSKPTCTDINECKENSSACDPQHGICTNTKGLFTCDCVDGYKFNGKNKWKCHPRPCPPLKDPDDGKMSGRVFEFGASVSFTCNAGYELVGPQSLACEKNGSWDGEEPKCQRISCGDPRNGSQPAHLILNSTEYNYQSKVMLSCEHGYELDLHGVSTIQCTSTGAWSKKLPTCRDVDECKTIEGICDVHANCVNTQGSYKCTCHPGWTGTGRRCEDIDECVSGGHDCSNLTVCTNSPGGYNCPCKEGLISDGRKCLGMCSEVTTTGDQGSFTWQQTLAGSMARASCEFGVVGVSPRIASAVRGCKETSPGEAAWDEPNLRVCKYENEKTNRLQQIAGEIITQKNVIEVSETLNAALSEGANDLTANDIDFTAKALENIVRIGGNSSTDKIGEQLLSITSSIMSAPAEAVAKSQRSWNATRKVVAVLDTFAEVGLSNERKTIEKKSRSVGLSANLVNDKEFKGSSFTLHRAQGTGEDSDLSKRDMVTETDSAIPSNGIDAQISLPPTLLKQASQSSADKSQKISFVVYENAKLFPLQENELESNLSIASRVISASVLGMKVMGLSNLVTIRLLHAQKSANESVCVFWDFSLHGGFGGWSTEGCYRDSDESTEQFTVCKCRHLTNFAIMMDLSYQVDGAGLAAGVETALSVVSYIGCALSIVGLTLTLAALIYFKKLRASLLHQIHIQLCSALLLMLIVFLIGTERHGWKSHNTCAAFGAMLHYFILAAFGWMGVEALYMYKSLIQVFNASSRKTFMLRASAVAWGIPLIPVIVVAAIDSENYTSSSYCWLNNIPAFFASFFAPIMAILIWNVIVFIWVLRILVRQSQAKSIRYGKGKQRSKRREFQASMAVMVLLGLTWLFGALMIRDGRLVFSFLFAISNSLQGFFVFLFHCALNKEVQKAFTFEFWPRMYRKHFVSTNSSSFSSRSTVRKPIRKGTVILDLDEKKYGLKKQDTLEESLDDGKTESCPAYSVCEDGLGQKEKPPPEEAAVENISIQQIPDIISELTDTKPGLDLDPAPTVQSNQTSPKDNTTEDVVIVLEPTVDEEPSDKEEQAQNSLPEQFGVHEHEHEHDHDNVVSEGEEVDSEYNPSDNTHSECGQSRGRSFTPSNQLTLEVGSPNVSVYLTEDS